MRRFFSSHGASIRSCIPGEHEVDAERGMRTVRESMRVKILELEADCKVPKAFLPWLAMDCTNTRNFIPNTRSSPRMPEEIFSIIHHINMLLMSIFLWFLIIYIPIFCAIKLAYVLTPQNPIAELQCWTLQYLDSQFMCFDDNLLFRPVMQEFSANLGKSFPRGSSWHLPEDLKVVELTPSTMKEYF